MDDRNPSPVKNSSATVNNTRSTAAKSASGEQARSPKRAQAKEESVVSVASTGEQKWPSVLKHLSGLFPKDIMSAWFSGISCVSEDENGVVLGVASDFASIWIEENYLDLIKKQYASIYGRGVDVRLTTETQSAKAPVKTAAVESMIPVERVVGPNEATIRMIHASPKAPAKPKINLNPRYTFDNFIVGTSNQLAHAASVAVSQNLARAYNPLFLYGDSGLGKTHLLQAIAHTVLTQNPNANVMYLSCEKFTNDFLRAIETHGTAAFRKHYRTADVLLIDDIQFLADKERTQEEFFHTFNELFESNKQICITSDRPASEISKLEARLVSRFQWGMVTDIQAPDLETRVAILRRKASLLNAKIPDEVLAFLAKSITRNVRRMEGALTRVASYTSLVNGTIDVARVEQLLQDILQEEAQTQLTIEKIQQKVTEYYRLRPADMQSKRRPTAIAFPRQVAMYLCRLLTPHSLQEIGELFGGRDHGTVIHACKTVENMMEQDESIKRSVELLQTQLSRRA